MLVATNPVEAWFWLEENSEGYKLVFVGDTHTVKVPVSKEQLKQIIKKAGSV